MMNELTVGHRVVPSHPTSSLARLLRLCRMSSRVTALSRILQSPARILGVLLLVVFVFEVGVMFLLPHVLPAALNETAEAVVDALLLTCGIAPVIWWIIVGPLRRIALSEHARSETIIANAGDGIILFDEAGNVISFNRAAARLFGVETAEMLGQPVRRVIPDMPSEPGSLLDISGLRSDGVLLPLAVSVSLVPSESTRSYVAIVRDLTESRRLEDERIAAVREREALRSQQMATLAQLATGVAHEIRNPLTAIKMLVQVNQEVFQRQGLPTSDLELVEHEIRRMERSVNSLLEYGRPTPSSWQRVSLGDVIGRTTQLISGRCAANHVTVGVSLPESDIKVTADGGQLQQLLLNLCLNAIDATPPGGTLTIELFRDGGDAVLAVSDSGAGISADVLNDLFTPFVTTKPEGVGLGLAICRRIAEDHQGRLTGENRAEGGARFELRLPLPDPCRAEDGTPCQSYS